jgi:hypothetical protein
MVSPTLSVALKEWSVVCDALQRGRQMILLRKGGIVEAIGGFELEQREFLLFPTLLHQNKGMLKQEVHARVEQAYAEPENITLTAAAEVVDIYRLSNRAQMDALDSEHIWTAPLIDMRFNYRPKNPLYLLIVRTHMLERPVILANTPEYAGCKSWVPLAAEIDCAASRPALDDASFEQHRERIKRALA